MIIVAIQTTIFRVQSTAISSRRLTTFLARITIDAECARNRTRRALTRKAEEL